MSLLDWTRCVSRTSGRAYFFNTRTGQSDYAEPPAVAAARAANALPPHLLSDPAPAPQIAGAPLHTVLRPPPPPPQPPPPAALAPPLPPGLTSAHPIAFRDALEAVCERLRAGGPAGADCGVCRLPPCDKAFRAMVHDMAEEFGLRSHAPPEVDACGLKAVILYLPGCPPPEVAAADAEEVALAAEAALRRQAEAAQLAAGAAAGGGGGGSKPRGGRAAGGAHAATAATDSSGGGGGGRAQQALLAAQAVRIVPLYEKRDKRSIAEIQDEITRRKGGGDGKRAKLLDAAPGAPAVGASSEALGPAAPLPPHSEAAPR